MGWKEDIIGRLWDARMEQQAAEEAAPSGYIGLKDGTEPVFALENQLEWRLPGPPPGRERGPEAWLAANREEIEQVSAEFWALCGEVADNPDLYLPLSGRELDIRYCDDGMRLRPLRLEDEGRQ